MNSLFRNKYVLYPVSLVYLSFLSYAVFFSRRRRIFIPLDERFNGIPFRDKFLYLTGQHSKFENMDPFNFYSDLFGNILLFIPLPFFLYFVMHLVDYKKIILAAFISSLLIETTQFVMDIGVADIDDVILNTAGAVAGILFIQLIKLLKWD